NERGGGGTFSTPTDLLIWNDALANNRLGAFLTEKLHEQTKLNSGRKIGYARGLFVNNYKGGKYFWHTGGSAGYSSLLSRYPEQNFSIVITCNSDDTVSLSGLARRIFDLFVPGGEGQTAENQMPPIAAEGIDLAGFDLNSRAGLYFNEVNGNPLQLI